MGPPQQTAGRDGWLIGWVLDDRVEPYREISQSKLTVWKWNLSGFLLGEDEGVAVLNTIACESQPILQLLALKLQLLLLSEQPLLVFYLLLQGHDETVGVNGIGMAPTIWILHKDLDFGEDGLQQTDGSVQEDPEISQAVVAAEELPFTARCLEGQTLQAQEAPAQSDLLFNLSYGLIRVHYKHQIWVTPLFHCHPDVSRTLYIPAGDWVLLVIATVLF